MREGTARGHNLLCLPAITAAQVALIDFTASRLVASEEPGSAAGISSRGGGEGVSGCGGGAQQQQVAFYDLSQDPEVFEGTLGDVQVCGQVTGGVMLGRLRYKNRVQAQVYEGTQRGP